METAKEVKYYYGEILEHIKTVDFRIQWKMPKHNSQINLQGYILLYRRTAVNQKKAILKSDW